MGCLTCGCDDLHPFVRLAAHTEAGDANAADRRLCHHHQPRAGKADVAADRLADRFWALTGPELYLLTTNDSCWRPDEYER